MLRLLFSILFLFTACKTSSHNSGGSPANPTTATTSNALSPTACASFYDSITTAPAVDPSTLAITSAKVQSISVNTGSPLTLPSIQVQADANADLTYYEACNVTQGCFDGLILMPISGQTGWYATYEYRLPADPAPYSIAVKACVRVDRVLAGKTGTVVHPTRFPDLELNCGNAYTGTLVYQQSPFPDSVLATKLKALDAQTVLVTQDLYAMVNAVQAYTQKNPSSASSTQLDGVIANLAAMREDLFPLARSSIMDQSLQAAQLPASSSSSLALAGTTAAKTPPTMCVTNAEVAQAVNAASSVLAAIPTAAEPTATPTTTTSTTATTPPPLGADFIAAGQQANQLLGAAGIALPPVSNTQTQTQTQTQAATLTAPIAAVSATSDGSTITISWDSPATLANANDTVSYVLGYTDGNLLAGTLGLTATKSFPITTAELGALIGQSVTSVTPVGLFFTVTATETLPDGSTQQAVYASSTPAVAVTPILPPPVPAGTPVLPLATVGTAPANGPNVTAQWDAGNTTLTLTWNPASVNPSNPTDSLTYIVALSTAPTVALPTTVVPGATQVTATFPATQVTVGSTLIVTAIETGTDSQTAQVNYNSVAVPPTNVVGGGKSGGMSGGAIAGAVIGSIAGAALVALAAWRFSVWRANVKLHNSIEDKVGLQYDDYYYGSRGIEHLQNYVSDVGSFGTGGGFFSEMEKPLMIDYYASYPFEGATYLDVAPLSKEAAHDVLYTKGVGFKMDAATGKITLSGGSNVTMEDINNYKAVAGSEVDAVDVRVELLASSPIQTFMTQLNPLTQTFLTDRSEYFAILSDIAAYLQANK